MKRDEYYMEKVLNLAKRGEGFVSPNPMVGALVVKSGKILWQAWHRKFGALHAEKELFGKLMKKRPHNKGAQKGNGKSLLASATLYVNLEPCVNFNGKKTPDCVSVIKESGISRVVIAMKDPNPSVFGRGIRALKKAGIEVLLGCLEKEAQRLNEKFVKWQHTGLPFIAMKVAMSLDGKIATKTGDSKWITSEKSRKFVKTLRDSFDAVLVGSRTVVMDNPGLAGKKREPLRIILDSTLRVSPRAKVLRDLNVLLVTTNRSPQSKRDFFLKRGFTLKVFPKKIELRPLLRFLAKQGMSSLLVEGGSEVFGSFVDSKLVDRYYWFIAPKIIGGRSATPAVGGKGISRMRDALTVKKIQVLKMGPDILIKA